ncbi:NDP-sugar synthase [Candidatus Dependentiae bacterium]|nr:NDP-sugar synthase [Candidatus Dependentiae bacterium]
MKALILSAGLGTRLRPLTNSIPKSLIRFGNKESIIHILNKLRELEISNAAINLHHLWKEIIRFFATTSGLEDFSFYFSYEEKLLGTGGAIINCKEYLSEDNFIVINSDIFTEINLKKLMAFHNEMKSDLTLVFKPSRKCFDMKIDSKFQVIEFSGKNFSPAPVAQGGIFTGISIWNPAIFEKHLSSCSSGTYYELSNDIILPLLRQCVNIHAYPHYEFWLDFGTPERLKRLQYHFKTR